MQTRRSFLAAAATGTVAGTAGCLDFILGDDLNFEATAASVSESALSETGYEERRIRKQSAEREFEAGGESRTVGITNYHAEYDRSIDLAPIGGGEQRAATFTATTTPEADVLGQAFNPIKDMSAADIVEIAQSRYEGFGTLSRQGEATAPFLGQSVTVVRFTGSADFADSGQQFDVELQVVDQAVKSNGDFAIAIGGYPEQLADRERENFFAMLEGVQHDG